MTARRDFLPVNSPANAQSAPADNGAGCELGRKRSLFLDFLQDFGFGGGPSSQPGPTTPEEDQLLAELFQGSQAPPAGILNDLPGVLTARAPATAALTKLEQQAAPAPAAAPQPAPAAAAPAGRPLHHRAVVTSMPMPAHTRAAAAAAGGGTGPAVDDDTSSQNTMPMPNRKRRRSGEDDDEACSSPNDLVEVPAAQTAAAAAVAARKRHAASAVPHPQDASSSRRDQQSGGGPGGVTNSNAAAGAANASAAASPDVHKGILVAKVLTKSDANSKRVILPRIAVETNLPQLSSAPHFHFTAADPAGTAWPLVIKAWANGSNPKPVYVMEMIGDVLKQYRLTIGDAVALLADQEGRFYLEWNTDAARAAAARPTYSGIVFKSASSNGDKEDAADAAAAVAAAPSSGSGGEAAAAPPAAAPAAQQQQQGGAQKPAEAVPAATTEQQQQQQPAAPAAGVVGVKSPFAAAEQAQAEAAAAGAAAAGQPLVAVKQEPQQAEAAGPSAAAVEPVTASQQQQLFQQLPASANMPLMTAIPVTSPQVPGTFIPTSPCQLLVVGHLPMPDLELDLAGPSGGLQPSLPSSMLGHLNSNGDVVMPPAAAGGCAGPAGGGAAGLETAQSTGDEALLVPTGAVPQLAHAGGVLLCPRTPGCTRPAGHQGWCLGHKGYKKRRT